MHSLIPFCYPDLQGTKDIAYSAISMSKTVLYFSLLFSLAVTHIFLPSESYQMPFFFTTLYSFLCSLNLIVFLLVLADSFELQFLKKMCSLFCIYITHDHPTETTWMTAPNH